MNEIADRYRRRADTDDGCYAPAVQVSDDAPVQNRLIALIGRDPRWTP